jgi:hypothetical protein
LALRAVALKGVAAGTRRIASYVSHVDIFEGH